MAENFQNPDYYIARIQREIPELVKKFNAAEFSLLDTSKFVNTVNVSESLLKVDADAYRNSILDSEWYGPYKRHSFDVYYFFTCKISQEFDYYAMITISFSEEQLRSISLRKRLFNQDIAESEYLEI